MLRERARHYVGFFRITLPQLREMLFISAGRECLSENLLQEICGAEIVTAFEPGHDGEQRFGNEAEANANAGREGLAVCAGVDHALAAGRGANILATKTQLPIRGVLHEIDRMAGRALVFLQYI